MKHLSQYFCTNGVEYVNFSFCTCEDAKQGTQTIVFMALLFHIANVIMPFPLSVDFPRKRNEITKY